MFTADVDKDYDREENEQQQEPMLKWMTIKIDSHQRKTLLICVMVCNNSNLWDNLGVDDDQKYPTIVKGDAIRV